MIAGFLVTRNRHELLITNLESAAALGFDVHILDATRESCAVALAFCKSHSAMHYHHLPEASYVERMLYGLENSDSMFCVQLSDDDFFSPKALAKCARFLEANPDHAAAQGAFWVAGGPSGIGLEHYCPSLDDDDPAQRLLRHATFYGHTAYALCRREEFIQSIMVAQKYGDNDCFIELVVSFTLALSGKVKRFPDMYCLRTHNSNQTLQVRYSSHPRLWLENDPEGYKLCLENFLVQFEKAIAGLPAVEGRPSFREIFDYYLRGVFDPFEDIVCRHPHLLFIMEQMGGTQNAFDALRNTERAKREEMSRNLEPSLRGFLQEAIPWKDETGLACMLPPADLPARLLLGRAS